VFRVSGLRAPAEFLGGAEQRLDGLVPELIAACLADASNDLLAAECLKIISGTAGSVLGFAGVVSARTGRAKSEAVNPPGDGDKAMAALASRVYRTVATLLAPAGMVLYRP
jgi:hypothetical protein